MGFSIGGTEWLKESPEQVDICVYIKWMIRLLILPIGWIETQQNKYTTIQHQIPRYKPKHNDTL